MSTDDLLPAPRATKGRRAAVVGAVAGALVAGLVVVGGVGIAQTSPGDVGQDLRAQADALDVNAAELEASADELRALADELDAPAPTTTTSAPTTTTTVPAPPAGETLHGAYVGLPWPGPLEAIDLHVGQGSWSGLRSSIGSWRTDLPVKVNMPLWPKQAFPRGSATLARAAAGDFDLEHRANAQAIRNRTDQHVWLALGHEANDASTQPWGFTGSSTDLANYRTAFNRIAAQYEAVLGDQVVDVVFMPGLWDVTLNNLRSWTPSASELVGIDFYDRAGNFSGTVQQRWDSRHKPGLDALAAYAAERGQRTIVGEWGLSAPCPPGGCDNPYFVRQSFAWFRQTNAVADFYHCSDRGSGGSADHCPIQDFPNAWNAYRAEAA